MRLFTGPGIAIVMVIMVAAAITVITGRAYRNTCSSYRVPAPAGTWKTAS